MWTELGDSSRNIRKVRRGGQGLGQELLQVHSYSVRAETEAKALEAKGGKGRQRSRRGYQGRGEDQDRDQDENRMKNEVNNEVKPTMNQGIGG